MQIPGKSDNPIVNRRDRTAAEGEHVLGPNAFPSMAEDPIGFYNLGYISPQRVPQAKLQECIRRVTSTDQKFAHWVVQLIIELDPEHLVIPFSELQGLMQERLPRGHELNEYRKMYGNIGQLVKQEKFLCFFAIQENILKLAGDPELVETCRAGKLPPEHVRTIAELRTARSEKEKRLGYK